MNTERFRPYCYACPMCVLMDSGGALECRLRACRIKSDDRCTLNTANIKNTLLGLRYYQKWRREMLQGYKALPPYVLGVIIDSAIEKMSNGN